MSGCNKPWVISMANPRQLGGALSTLDTGLVAPTSKPSVNFLNFADFKGTYDYANNFVLGGTSFVLSDVVDVALHPGIVSDTTLTDSIEGVPSDATAGPAPGPQGTADAPVPSVDPGAGFDHEIP
jgi:hypothetical protein